MVDLGAGAAFYRSRAIGGQHNSLSVQEDNFGGHIGCPILGL